MDDKIKARLKDIYEYIAFDSKYYAKRTVLKLRQKPEILKSHPQIGKIVLEFHNEKIRELTEGNYRIIYKIITETKIDILNVFHSKRDLSQYVLS
jgi:toxin ParE1/3/4